MKARFLATIVALLVAAPALDAQSSTSTSSKSRDRRYADEDYRSRIDTTITFSRDGVVDLSLISGEIRVVGWNRGEVKIVASSERGLIRMDATGSRLALNVRSDRGRMGDTQYELSVPEGVRVISKAVSGDISVTGTKGEIEVGSVSGDVEVADGSRRVSASSVSGSVRVQRVQGDLRANSVSGDLEATQVSGDVSVETVSGELTLERIASRYVRAETVSGTVDFDGNIDNTGRYEFHSHSGDVNLVVPDGMGATISVETFSGGIDSDFPITIGPNAEIGRGRRFEFTVGSGGARITAESFSGNINITKSGGRR